MITSQQSEPQQMPAPQPVVVVVNNAPFNHRQGCYSRQAYLNRGAQFSNGCRCYLPHMIMLCTLGSFILFIGFSIVTIGLPSGIMILVMGGILLGLGIYLIRTAKKQFNSLPVDHPDRIKYAIRSIPGIGHSPAVYTVPPMQNQMIPYPSAPGGQVYLMQLPPGSVVPTPGVDGSQMHFGVPPGGSSPHNPYVPDNDPPPAYSDVVHNI